MAFKEQHAKSLSMVENKEVEDRYT